MNPSLSDEGVAVEMKQEDTQTVTVNASSCSS